MGSAYDALVIATRALTGDMFDLATARTLDGSDDALAALLGTIAAAQDANTAAHVRLDAEFDAHEPDLIAQATTDREPDPDDARDRAMERARVDAMFGE